MADSKLLNMNAEHSSDLIQCDICYAVIDQPKALPCLHTFCLKCLSSWHESTSKKDPSKYDEIISCPNCREEFPIPREGVKGLRTNFFVNKLKERDSIQKKLFEKDAAIPCTSCDPPSDSQATSRCVECNDFLCKNCDTNHKSMRVLKYHHVLSLDELRAGKLTMHNLPEQEMCPKHKGEFLRFYCETCDQPMCRDCTVVDHPRPDHKQVDLTSVTDERIKKLKKILEKSEVVPLELDVAIQSDDIILKELDSNVEKAICRFHETTQKAETEFTQNIRQIQAKRKKEIEAHRDFLQTQKSRLCNAMELTKQVTENGSDHDVATMYSSLVSAIHDDTKVCPRGVGKTMGKLEFQPTDDLNNGLSALGALNTYDQWVLDKTIGSGNIGNVKYIVLDTEGNIAVSTFTWNPSVRFLKNDGQILKKVKTSEIGGLADYRSAYPWGIVIGNNGSLFVTDQNAYVKVFDSTYKFKQRIEVKNPSGGWSENSSVLLGLAIGMKGLLYVGCTNQRYVSISEQDGSHVSCFKVNLVPYFIAVTRYDNVIISDYKSRAVHVYDPTTSNQLYTFAAPSKGTDQFYPSGLCVFDDEVYVASNQSVPAIYRYTLEGKYLGIVTKDVNAPWGLVPAADGKELFVCNESNVKVFRRK